MKKNPFKTPRTLSREPSEDEIRDYAYHLYQQSGCTPGHDLDNWLEAKACLEANVARQHTRVRLHQQRQGTARSEVTVIALEPPVEKQSEPLVATAPEEAKPQFATSRRRR
jgi:hypothetical protein